MLPDYAKEEILILGSELRSRLADVRTGKKIQNQVLSYLSINDRLTLLSMVSVYLTAFYSLADHHN